MLNECHAQERVTCKFFFFLTDQGMWLQEIYCADINAMEKNMFE